MANTFNNYYMTVGDALAKRIDSNIQPSNLDKFNPQSVGLPPDPAIDNLMHFEKISEGKK